MAHNIANMLNSLLNDYSICCLILIMVFTFLLTAVFYIPLHTQVHELGHVVAIKHSAKSLGYALKYSIKISNKFIRGRTSSDFYAYLATNKYDTISTTNEYDVVLDSKSYKVIVTSKSNKCNTVIQRKIKYNAIAGLIATFYLQLPIIIVPLAAVLWLNLDRLVLLIISTFIATTTLLLVLLTVCFFHKSSDWDYFRHPELFEYKSDQAAAPTTPMPIPLA